MTKSLKTRLREMSQAELNDYLDKLMERGPAWRRCRTSGSTAPGTSSIPASYSWMVTHRSRRNGSHA